MNDLMNNDTFKDFDKNFNRAVKAGKALIVVTVIGAIATAGLITWVAVHFLTKWW